MAALLVLTSHLRAERCLIWGGGGEEGLMCPHAISLLLLFWILTSDHSRLLGWQSAIFTAQTAASFLPHPLQALGTNSLTWAPGCCRRGGLRASGPQEPPCATGPNSLGSTPPALALGGGGLQQPLPLARHRQRRGLELSPLPPAAAASLSFSFSEFCNAQL